MRDSTSSTSTKANPRCKLLNIGSLGVFGGRSFPRAPVENESSNREIRIGDHEQASFIRIKLQWGGGLGGWVFSRVGGSKALDPPPPLIILRVSWVGLLPHLLSLVTGALSGCLLVPLSVVSFCRWQVCRWQFFTWRTFFLITC